MTGFLEANANLSNRLDTLELTMGENKFRIFGEVLQRYVYWTKDKDGKPIQLECLSFDREKGRFTNIEKDHFVDYFPHVIGQDGEPVLDEKTGEPKPTRPQWSYVCLAFDLKEGSPDNPVIKVLYLKKKFFADLQALGKKRLGDPTDPEDGWDIVLEKTKTGPLPFNIAYTVDQLGCQDGKRPLTQAEKDAIEEVKPISEIITRLTPEEQEALIKERILATSDDAEVDGEAINELDG